MINYEKIFRGIILKLELCDIYREYLSPRRIIYIFIMHYCYILSDRQVWIIITKINLFL